MKNLILFFLTAIVILVATSCEKSNDPSKTTKFELINQLAETNVSVVQINTNDELLIGAPNNGIFLFNEVLNELKEVMSKEKIWNIQNHKISIGKSIIVHYHRDAPQTYKSTDDGNTWSQFFIDNNKTNEYMPIVSGNHFFVVNQVVSKIYVLDSDFTFLETFDIQSGIYNSIYPWFDGNILLKEQTMGISKWFILDYFNKSKTEIEFNQPGDYSSFLIQNNNIIAYKIQGSKVFISADLGKTFLEVPNLPATTIHDVKLFNNYLYIASDKGVFRTNNKGESWETIYTSADEPAFGNEFKK